jgi:hypothetical protein
LTPVKIWTLLNTPEEVYNNVFTCTVLTFDNSNFYLTFLTVVRGQCMSKEMLVIPVNRVVDKKKIIRTNGGPRRKSGTRGR